MLPWWVQGLSLHHGRPTTYTDLLSSPMHSIILDLKISMSAWEKWRKCLVMSLTSVILICKFHLYELILQRNSCNKRWKKSFAFYLFPYCFPSCLFLFIKWCPEFSVVLHGDHKSAELFTEHGGVHMRERQSGTGATMTKDNTKTLKNGRLKKNKKFCYC